MKYSEENVEKISQMIIKLTNKERKLSFLIVFEPSTPYIYQQNGKHAESKLITSWNAGKITDRLPYELRSKISNSKDFLDTFAYLEFYLNQLLKLLIVDSVQIVQWEKQEALIGGKYLRFEDKKELIKKYSPGVWGKIKINLKSLQNLRNSLAHSPVGPTFYNGKLIDWELVDKHICAASDNILGQYINLQAPLLIMLRQLKDSKISS